MSGRLSKICVRKSDRKGLGIFAQKRFVKDETIEQARVILLPNPQWELLEQTDLKDYYFYWNENTMAFPLGCGALYNHATSPNARIVRKFEENIIEFVALRNIEVDEEITIDYDCPLWFEVVP